MIKRLLVSLVYIVLNICIACDYSYVIDRPEFHKSDDFTYDISIDSTNLDTNFNDTTLNSIKQIDSTVNNTDSIPIIFIVDVKDWEDPDN